MQVSTLERDSKDPYPQAFRYCRVWQIGQPQIDQVPEYLPQAEVKKHVLWESQEDINIVEFNYENRNYYLVHCKPAWYTYWKDNFKLVDLSVVSESKEEAIRDFNKIKEYALEERRKMLIKVKELISEIQGISEVVVVMGRGTMFNEHRLPATGQDDADLMLFISQDFTNEAEIKELLDKLKSIIENHPELDGYYGIYSFRGSSQDKQLVAGRENAGFKISFDLFPLPFLEKNIASLIPHLKPYYIEALEYGSLLLDRSGEVFDKLRKKVLVSKAS